MAQYYRMPVKDWQRFQLQIMRMTAATTPEIDVRRLERKHAQAAHKNRILAFKQFVERCEKSVSISDKPCSCGRNHFAIVLKNGKEFFYCPVTFWLNMCQTKRLRSTSDMLGWSKNHPLSNYLHRIDESKDATYEEPNEANC